MIGCKNKVLRFIYVLIYEDNFPVFSTCVEVIPCVRDVLIRLNCILYMRRGDSHWNSRYLHVRWYSLHA